MPQPAKDVSHLIPQVREMVKGGHVTVRDVAAQFGLSRRQAHKLLTATRDDVPDLLAVLVADKGRGVGEQEAASFIRAAGMWCGFHRLRHLLAEAKADSAPKDTPENAEFAPLESRRRDGLFTGADLARAFGVSRGAITRAVEDGLLTVARWERWGKRYRPLYGPAEKIAPRTDGWPGPVDAWHPKAARKDEQREGTGDARNTRPQG